MRLGPYQILAPLGAGGMAEVYRARDTRLARNVAIKVLPAEFTQNASLRTRLEREARVIAGLNHPHICALHDVGSDQGIDYLVLEYCEGNTLAERLSRGPLKLREVLQTGAQIADALSRAHREGVVHRDVKPSNVMLTASGVKLLDFGLARQNATVTATDVTASLGGALIGTVAYMAPEVLAGGESDERSDLFALGVVLYEMLTGTLPFPGETSATVMAAILEKEPRPLRDVQPGIPPALERLIATCLAKDPRQRWESAHDLALQLRSMSDDWPSSVERRRPWLLPALAVLAVAAGMVAVTRWPRARPAEVARLSIPVDESPLPAGVQPAFLAIAHGMGTVAISPDGSRVAFAVSRGEDTHLYVRSIDRSESTRLAGIDYAAGLFFSPDGEWIGYYARGALHKIRVSGGAPETLHVGLNGNARGGTWASNGMIYFVPGPSTGLWQVPADGSAPAKPLTEPNLSGGESSHRWPVMLPDGKHVLFTVRTDQIQTLSEASIAVLSLETGRWRVVMEGGARARYVAPGLLIFARAGTLYQIPFDLKTLTVRGAATKVQEGVATSSHIDVGIDYDISSSGHLVYVPGEVPPPSTNIVRVDRTGRTTATMPLRFRALRMDLSPDRTRLALNVVLANDDIYVYDLASGLANRLTFEPGDETRGIWTADGERVIYSSLRPPRILQRRADGAGQPEVLVRSPLRATPNSCSPDGRWMLYTDNGAGTGSDLWLLSLRNGGDRRALLNTRFNEEGGAFSPDSKWIVYVSDESGAWEIYVRAVDDGGGRWQVSTAGGRMPRWSADGKEIFFFQGDQLLAVPVDMSGGRFRPAQARLLFSMPHTGSYDVDGDAFLLLSRPGGAMSMPRHLNVVLNWTSSLPR
jgi:serine/threonine protein kinase/Tol biopolymer transport system component